MWLIILIPGIRVASYFVMKGSRGQLGMMLQTGGDTILTGCLGALMEKKQFFSVRIIPVLKNKIFIWLVSLFLFVVATILNDRYRGSYYMTVGLPFNNFCILFLLYWSIYVPSKWAKFLNYRIIAQIGVLSYSLYVWQQLFLTSRTKFVVNQFPLNLLLVLVVAFVSYHFIEKPILKLKHRYKRI